MKAFFKVVFATLTLFALVIGAVSYLEKRELMPTLRLKIRTLVSSSYKYNPLWRLRRARSIKQRREKLGKISIVRKITPAL